MKTGTRCIHLGILPPAHLHFTLHLCPSVFCPFCNALRLPPPCPAPPCLCQVGPLNPLVGDSNVATKQDSRWNLHQVGLGCVLAMWWAVAGGRVYLSCGGLGCVHVM